MSRDKTIVNASVVGGKPDDAPLTHGDVPEQDGSEDPGAGLESIHDAGLLPEVKSGSSELPSPSTAEHVDTRSGINVPKSRPESGGDKQRS